YWNLPDQLVARLDEQWQKNRQLYLDRGGVSIRANAMLMELHALAALAGHEGASRQDARLPGLVKLFTTPPVVVYKTTTKRSTASFPHTPAWESVYRADSEKAVLHPSADAIIARALAVAWRARDVAGLPLEDSQRIQQVVGAVARGSWYKAPSRAENQINWNSDVYAANLEVTGDRSNLPDYRAHLKWFVDHAFKIAYKRGSSNLSRGYGFRYLPQYEGGSANKVDTVEYANLVHSTLGFYATAVRAGMRPLRGDQVAKLRAWSRHILFGTWTHSGYLNWDSGLGTSRRHLRQYWAFALDSLVRASGPGALLGTSADRAYVRYIAEQGLELFKRNGWDGTGPLPTATSFDAPNGFPSGTRSPLITPLRFAVIAASLDVRLPATAPRAMGNMYSHDSEFGRLAISTPSYNLAVIKPVSQGEGGLEPTRLFDARQRPLTVLGAGGFGGPSPGLRLQRYGSTVLEDQPGTQKGRAVPGMSVAGNRRNRSGLFKTMKAGGTMRAGSASIAAEHTFARDAIETKYKVSRGAATSITMRMPVWGRESTVDLLRGARVSGKRIIRTSGAILIRGTTSDGGVMLVAFRGIPNRASIVVVRHDKSSRAPQGARELRITFKADKGMTLERRIAVVAAAPDR
ncbi:MAG: hypothetical protein Q7T55_21150, partial [Solirubrobacteraceae bacterium]|nr:hypothetical protein [Solirubrobacteraceae bacterium]